MSKPSILYLGSIEMFGVKYLQFKTPDDGPWDYKWLPY